MKIYGNERMIGTFQNMLKNDRMAHSFLIYGEKGLGKKLIADYLAMLLVCENEERPCGSCRSCRNAASHVHPDIIYAEHSGKLGGFSVDTIRNICSDAYIRPNNSDRKIYIFTDADNMTVQAQNSLLKLIEEPPSYAYFIFTASYKNVFLETILSRIISLNVSETDRETALDALCSMGIPKEKADEAVKCFGGNIGMCAEYANSEELRATVGLTKKITDCIINRDEYGLLLHLTETSADKELFRSILSMLDRITRDALAFKFSRESVTGCYKEGAVSLSEGLTMLSCENIHDALGRAHSLIERNVNIKLIASSLCGEIAACR